MTKHDLRYGRSLSPGEIEALEVLRVVKAPVITHRSTSRERECISHHAANKLVRRGFVTIAVCEDYSEVHLTEMGVDFLDDAFKADEDR